MKVLIITSGSPNSNTELLVNQFKQIIVENEGEYRILHTSDIKRPCLGCVECTSCCIHDQFTDVLHENKFDCIVLAGAVYFFGLNSNLHKALERFYGYSLLDVPIGLILTSGSNFYAGGVDLIIKQFERIDSYCGSITVTPYNKVTFDMMTPVNDIDVIGLTNLYNSLSEVVHNEVDKKS